MRRFLCAALLSFALPAVAASFDYHGSLQDGGKPADGKYDLQLTLYSEASGGKVVGGPLILYAVPVHNGSFDTQADFGPLTNAQNAWLGVSVRTAGSGNFSALGTRAAVTAAITGSVCPGAWTLAGNAGNPAGSYLGTADNNPLVFEVNGSQAGTLIPTADATFTDAPIVVFGSSHNMIVGTGVGATIAGGGSTYAGCGTTGHSLCINQATGRFSTVSGGLANIASIEWSTIDGGYSNTVSGIASTIGGGVLNTASGYAATIGGGVSNTASGGNSSTVVGGYSNTAGGQFSTVGGGSFNTASADQSFAAGYSANVRSSDTGTFVWSDSTASATAPFTSTGANQFLINATGGVGIGTNNPNGYQLNVLATNKAIYGGSNSSAGFGMVADNQAGGDALYVGGTGATTGTVIATAVGAYLSSGGQWVNKSDRAAKAGFAAIDVGHVLDEVVAMPVTRWFYKAEGDAIHHIGPVAQDFHAAFGLGRDDKTIGTVDEGGVALAAIQGLNKKLEIENKQLHEQIDALSVRLSALEHGKGE